MLFALPLSIALIAISLPVQDAAGAEDGARRTTTAAPARGPRTLLVRRAARAEQARRGLIPSLPTRLSERRRIEHIDPGAWLERFGPVQSRAISQR